jgi:hypothetical protein
MRDVSQPTVSRIVTALVPAVKAALEEFVPSAADAIEMVKGRICLVDGTITPCWSYDDHREPWSRKHGTTGFNAQLVCLLNGDAIYVSDPLPGRTHDAAAFRETPARHPPRVSCGNLAAASATRVIRGAVWSRPGKRPPAALSAREIRKITQ